MFLWAFLLLLLTALPRLSWAQCQEVELLPIPDCSGDTEPDIRVNPQSGCEEWFCNNFDDYGDDDGEEYEECPEVPAKPTNCEDESLLEVFDDESGCQTGWECLGSAPTTPTCNDVPEPAARDDCDHEPILDAQNCVTDWECIPRETQPVPVPATEPPRPETEPPPLPIETEEPPTLPPLTPPDAGPIDEIEPPTLPPTLPPTTTTTTTTTQATTTVTNVGRPIGVPEFRCPDEPEPRESPRCAWTPTINRWTGCVTGWICLEPAGDRKFPCPIPPRPPSDAACRWRPLIDSKGCTIDYDCEPVYVVPPEVTEPPEAKRWPCPFVKEPQPRPGCRWTARIHPATLCIAHYECATEAEPDCPSEPGEKGFVPYPDDVPECRWFPMFGDDGCIVMYMCERRSGCPLEPERPEDSPSCLYAPIVDSVTGCLLQFQCSSLELGVEARLGYTSSYDEASFLLPQKPGDACDWTEPNACTSMREPMEWGCCRDHYAGSSQWAASGCECDSVQGRCVIRRWEAGQSQWAFCIPKASFDCYWNFFLAGFKCGEKDRPKPTPSPFSAQAPARRLISRTPLSRQGPYV